MSDERAEVAVQVVQIDRIIDLSGLNEVERINAVRDALETDFEGQTIEFEIRPDETLHELQKRAPSVLAKIDAERRESMRETFKAHGIQMPTDEQ